jgi:CTP:molybdopterin cytidylyltransferase MocA
MIFAVVPAAGHSTRMGRPKLALPLAGGTVLERVVAALRAGGCDHVVVVLSPRVRALAPPAASAGAHVCLLPGDTPDMRATVEHGLRWLEWRFIPQPDDAWLLAPGDHPALDGGVVRRLIEAYAPGGHSVVVPTVDGRRGHPTLIAWRHVAGMRTHPAGQGINGYVRTLGEATLAVPVSDRGIVCDLDTPADYERLRARFGG